MRCSAWRINSPFAFLGPQIPASGKILRTQPPSRLIAEILSRAWIRFLAWAVGFLDSGLRGKRRRRVELCNTGAGFLECGLYLIVQCVEGASTDDDFGSTAAIRSSRGGLRGARRM